VSEARKPELSGLVITEVDGVRVVDKSAARFTAEGEAAYRAAHCFMACDGIPTEALESGALAKVFEAFLAAPKGRA
jgi:hypothetical protein